MSQSMNMSECGEQPPVCGQNKDMNVGRSLTFLIYNENCGESKTFFVGKRHRLYNYLFIYSFYCNLFKFVISLRGFAH